VGETHQRNQLTSENPICPAGPVVSDKGWKPCNLPIKCVGQESNPCFGPSDANIPEMGAPTFCGYAGYFQDPDGHVWEVAWNPTSSS
jgi:hypothetical protein